jgi:hypothetical protein
VTDGWIWATVGLLGVWHGINPAMGWLFAVASGMQERSAAAVWRSLGPLAAGHALAVAGAVLAAALMGAVLPIRTVQWIVAGALVAMGVYRLVRSRHPRFGGMQMGPLELATWSLLMATAHGAGLMVVPLVLRDSAFAAQGTHHLAVIGPGSAVGMTLVHTGSYLLVTAGVASVVYGWLGLRQLRRLWVNLDLAWGLALVLTGVATAWV